jgi:hypothetical protein
MGMETISSFFQAASYPTWVGLGIALRLFVGMRQFNRRGWGGLQHFSNYFVGLLTLFVEGVLRWIGMILIVWGLLGWCFL